MCFNILCYHIKSVTIQPVLIETTYMRSRLKLQPTLNISEFQTFVVFLAWLKSLCWDFLHGLTWTHSTPSHPPQPSQKGFPTST